MEPQWNQVRVIEYERGERIFHQGERGEVMYVIRQGVVEIRRRIRDRDFLLSVLRDGDFFGELAIVNNQPRTATAIAREPCRLLVVTADELVTMLEGNAEIAARMIKMLAGWVHRLTLQLESALRGAEHYRVLEILCILIDEHQSLETGRSSRPLYIPVNAGVLAQQSALTRDKAVAILSWLAQVGLLDPVAEEDGEDEVDGPNYVITAAEPLLGLLQIYDEPASQE